jgi:hypothetical protein
MTSNLIFKMIFGDLRISEAFLQVSFYAECRFVLFNTQCQECELKRGELADHTQRLLAKKMW